MLTCAKLKLHCTNDICFEVQIHQVPHLRTGEEPGTRAGFPAQTWVLFHICVRNLYAKGMFKENPKDGRADSREISVRKHVLKINIPQQMGAERNKSYKDPGLQWVGMGKISYANLGYV